MEALSCGHAPVERAAAWRVISEALSGKEGSLGLEEAVRRCFVGGSAVAVDSAVAAIHASDLVAPEALAAALRPLVAVTPFDNLSALSSAAIDLAIRHGVSDAALAFVHGGAAPSLEFARIVVREVRVAAATSPQHLHKVVLALRPYFFSALTSPAAPAAVAIALRAALFRYGREYATEVLLPLLSRLQLHGDAAELIYDLARSIPPQKANTIVAYAMDLGINGNSAAVVAIIEALGETALNVVGVWNLVFLTSCVTLRCCLRGDLQGAETLLRVLLRWMQAGLDRPDAPTVAFAYSVTLVFSACAHNGHNDDDDKLSISSQLAALTLQAALRRHVEDKEEKKLLDLRELMKVSVPDGKTSSVLLALLHKVRNLWKQKSTALASWLPALLTMSSRKTLPAELPLYISNLTSAFLLHPSTRVRIASARAVRKLPSESTSALLPILLAALGRESVGGAALEMVRSLGTLATDKFSSQAVLATLVELTKYRSQESSESTEEERSALARTTEAVIASVAAEKPTIAFGVLTDLTDAVFVNWETSSPSAKASAAAAALVVIRQRPSRGTAFVPLLQRCLQDPRDASLSAATALRALRCLCDDGVLDALKTVRLVLKSYEPTLSAVYSLDPTVRCAFLHFTGSAAAAKRSKKAGVVLDSTVNLLRDVLRTEANDFALVAAAAEALANFDEAVVMDFVGEPEDESERAVYEARNKELVREWMAAVIRRAGMLEFPQMSRDLLLRLIRHEWANRRMSEWTEMRILKLATATLKQLRESDNGDGSRAGVGIAERLLAASQFLPTSGLRSLVEASAMLVDGDRSAAVAVDVLTSAQALITGLPWAELFLATIQRADNSLPALQSAVRGIFVLTEALADPVIAALFSKLQVLPNEVLDEVVKETLRSGRSVFVGQVLEQYCKRGRYEVLFQLAAQVLGPDMPTLIRLVTLSLDQDSRVPTEALSSLASVIARLPLDVSLRLIGLDGTGFSLRCSLVGRAGYPLHATVWPALRKILSEEYASDVRLRLHTLLDAIDRLDASHEQESKSLFAEAQDAARDFGMWGSLVCSSVGAASVSLWCTCTGLEDAKLLVL